MSLWPFALRSTVERERRQVAWLYERIAMQDRDAKGTPEAWAKIRQIVREEIGNRPELRPEGNPTMREMERAARVLGAAISVDVRPAEAEAPKRGSSRRGAGR